MTNSLCLTTVCSLKSPNKPGIIIGNSVAGKVFRVNELFQSSRTAKFQSLEVKATNGNQRTKPNSIVCADCDGNELKTKWKYLFSAFQRVKNRVEISVQCISERFTGAVQCSQCKGTGVNSVDHFNGQFKAGGLCWLCRGKRDILCGNCNGAGFVGGFMSTIDG